MGISADRTFLGCKSHNTVFANCNTLIKTLLFLSTIMRTTAAAPTSWRQMIENQVEGVSASVFQRFWRWRLENSPEFATAIGEHAFDDRLDEMSFSSYLRRQSSAKEFLREIEDILAVVPSSNRDVLMNLELLCEDLKGYVDGVGYKSYLWPLNRLEGPQSDFPRLISYMKKDDMGDFNNILNRFKLFAQQIDETISLLQEGMNLGLTMHMISISPVPNQLFAIAQKPVEASDFFKPFQSKPNKFSYNEWSNLTTTAKSLINSSVYPAYKRLGDFLSNTYMKNTRAEIAISSLPGGKDLYAKCLKFHTTTNLTAEEVHDIGKREVQRILSAMEEVKTKTKFQGTLADFRAYMRTDSKFKFNNASEMLATYNNLRAQIAQQLPKYFTKLPESQYVIEPVPEDIAPNFPGAYYRAPSKDGSRPGTFMINTYLPETRNNYECVCLSLHEAEPGHHLQSSLTMESTSLVEFRRFMEDRKYYEPPARFAMNTAYSEGWALYAEYLGEEMGLYTDPYDMFGRLSHEMLRACRLVVDTGMHALGWSRDDAIQFMLNNTAASKHDIEAEIDRYITWPGQACGYKIGEIKIKEMRSKAERALGKKFKLKAFHNLIASMGGVPISMLERKIDLFIQDGM